MYNSIKILSNINNNNNSIIHISSLNGEGISIDWGDGSLIDVYDGRDIDHDYLDNGRYIITISNVISIEPDFLTSHNNIESIEISVPNIAEQCLASCDNLKEIILHNNVENIGDSFAIDCLDLENVYMLSTTPPIIGNDFTSRNSSEEVNIYALNTQAYQNSNDAYSYKTIPIVNSIRYVYKTLANILDTKYNIVIDENQIENIVGLNTLIDKVGDI